MVFERVVQGQNVSSVTQSASVLCVVPPAYDGIAGIHPNVANPTTSVRVWRPSPDITLFEMPPIGVQSSLPPLTPLEGRQPSMALLGTLLQRIFQCFLAILLHSDGESLMSLQRKLKGNARETVHCHLLHPASVLKVMMTLQTLFGRPELRFGQHQHRRQTGLTR